jgi:hypothetical protein
MAQIGLGAVILILSILVLLNPVLGGISDLVVHGSEIMSEFMDSEDEHEWNRIPHPIQKVIPCKVSIEN